MACFKLAFAIVVAASAHLVHGNTMPSQHFTSDDVTLLQSQVQEKAAKSDADLNIEDGDEYDFKESLKCAEKESTPALAASLAELSPVSKLPVSEHNSVTASTTSSNPPGSCALKAVCYLMILCLLVDGIRRWNVQDQDAIKHQVANKKLADTDSAAEASWVDMVNAAASGDVNSFEMALKHEPHVMQADNWGCTPLHFSAVGGSVAIATELLKRGADVDALDACEETPLHFAARAGQTSMCELLLGAGAKIDAVNEQGFTPLVVAGQAHSQSACRFLVKHSAGVAGLADEELPPIVVSQLVQKIFEADQ